MFIFKRSVVVSLATAAALSAAACGLHPGEAWNRSEGGGGGTIGGVSPTSGSEDATDQSQGLCPASSSLTGTHASGDICSTPSDCATTCCDCGTGSQSWLSASCVGGRCVDSVTSCGRTQARYCGGGGIVVVPGSGASSQCTTGTEVTACESCIHASCCNEAIACGSDPTCTTFDACVTRACGTSCAR